MRLHASDPIRFNPGDHHGGGTTPGSEDHQFHVATEHLERQLHLLEQLYAALRRERLSVYSETGYALSAARIDLGPQTQDQFRVTHIYAYAGAASTLYLQGGAASPTLKIPLPATTAINLVLGDGKAGGLILSPRDARYVTTDNASSQLLICMLMGETLADSYLS